VPGSGFGLRPEYLGGGRLRFTPHPRAANCVRVCFSVPEELLREGVTRLAEFIQRNRR
jgi:aspartate/methionine/tyrosine aminotransferase